MNKTNCTVKNPFSLVIRCEYYYTNMLYKMSIDLVLLVTSNL